MRNYTTTTTIGGAPASGVSVRVSTDLAGAFMIASGASTTLGVAVFSLDDGAYYVWRQRNGATWANPEAITVSAGSVASTLDGTLIGATATLAPLADLKAEMGIASADTALDSVLTAKLAAATVRMCGQEGAGRELLEAARTWYFDVAPGTRRLYLPVFPVVSIAQVREALFGRHDDMPDLVEGNGWWANYERGILFRVSIWLPGDQTVRATYTAGYGGTYPVPDDLREACLRQAMHDYSTQKSGGATSMSAGGGNVQLIDPVELLPDVASACKCYRRYVP